VSIVLSYNLLAFVLKEKKAGFPVPSLSHYFDVPFSERDHPFDPIPSGVFEKDF
jgi:hypothetical protein